MYCIGIWILSVAGSEVYVCGSRVTSMGPQSRPIDHLQHESPIETYLIYVLQNLIFS